MPNVLAHFGAQAPLLRGLVREEHLRWLLLGCVIPDLPWILHRVLGSVAAVGHHPYLFRLYAMVQATLLFSVVLSVGIALLTDRPGRIAFLLAVGSLLHLLVDAAQTKWGNGVHLFAPVSWETLNLGWFWPESGITLALTGAGVLYLVAEWWAGRGERRGRTGRIARFRLAGSGWRGRTGWLALAAYLFLPPAFMPAALASDSHSLKTLSEETVREGRPVEIDRARYRPADGHGRVIHMGDTLRVTGALPPEVGTVSLRGEFTDHHTVRVTDVHVHRARLRDGASIAGLAILLIVWWRSASISRWRAHAGSPSRSEPMRGKGT